jgi:hypothetical protein
MDYFIRQLDKKLLTPPDSDLDKRNSNPRSYYGHCDDQGRKLKPSPDLSPSDMRIETKLRLLRSTLRLYE